MEAGGGVGGGGRGVREEQSGAETAHSRAQAASELGPSRAAATVQRHPD